MTTEEIVCSHCGKDSKKPAKEIKRQTMLGQQNFYCNRECATKFVQSQETRYKTMINMVSVHNSNDCLIWPFASGRDSRRFIQDPDTHKNTTVARMCFRETHGYIPPVVRHSCDNPPCFNPRHLLPGTNCDNVADRVERNRSAIGETHGRSKLSEIEAVEIFFSEESPLSLAQRFDVSTRSITDIQQEKKWKSTIARIKEGTSWSEEIHAYDPETKQVFFDRKSWGIYA